MTRKKREHKPGYGKLLDAWVAPEDAGDPVGCVATSFTFSPAFFEEECLARFLQLESDPTEDGPIYLVEREEKLAQVACAAALVDQHHCRGSRSLRWDLLAARLPNGLLHAKICLLYWSRLLRVVIGSANLTDDGYRRNQEIFGVIDFHADCASPRSVLEGVVEFLRQAASYSGSEANRSPALFRWNTFLSRVMDESRGWGLPVERQRIKNATAQTVFSGPGYPAVFETLKATWPGSSPPKIAAVVSPFFDNPEVRNVPASELWKLLRRRGEATVEFHVTAEDVPGEPSLFVHAPKSLSDAQPQGRSEATTEFYRVTLTGERSLHAKCIWLEDARWILYQIGSTNFTSAGTGLSDRPNLEANLAYVVDKQRNQNAEKLILQTFPDSELIDRSEGIKWKPLSGEGEDAIADELGLPPEFSDAVFHTDDQERAVVTLTFCGLPPEGWCLLHDGHDELFFNEDQWRALQSPERVDLTWRRDRPPSGFWVTWCSSGGSAWWPVNVTSSSALPPPEELRNLPLEVLLNILSSARPLHRVLGEYLRRGEQQPKNGETVAAFIDPHRRVDTSQFLLQRTRRLSWALAALRRRLERPAATREFLQWRLRGPVGVLALAKALVREARSDDEKAFLISELALELSRVNPIVARGCLTPEQHMAEIMDVISELRQLVLRNRSDGPKNLHQYVDSVFEAISP